MAFLVMFTEEELNNEPLMRAFMGRFVKTRQRWWQFWRPKPQYRTQRLRWIDNA